MIAVESTIVEDMLILQTAEQGSDELLDAVDRLIDLEKEELVDRILNQRWDREPSQAIEVEYIATVMRGKKKTDWTGARQSPGWRMKDLTQKGEIG